MNAREWFTASELAGLPGVPESTRRVLDCARRGAWVWRDRQGQGGGREFHIESLPPKTRLHLKGHDANGMPVERAQTAAASLVEYFKLPASKRHRADARMRVLRALEQFEIESQHSGREAAELFTHGYNAGTIAVDADVRELVGECTVATLYRWRSKERELGIIGLADDYGNRRGATKIDENHELKTAVLGLIATVPKIRPKVVSQFLAAKYPEAAASISERTVERFMARWKGKNAQAWLRHTNPDAWKNKHQAAFGKSSEQIVRLNQLWELDSTPADVMLSNGRHSVIGVVDVFSRRFKLLVSETSKATMIATLFRRAVLAWGVPEACKTDRGQDYLAQHLRTVFRNLDIQHIICMPFAGEQKPHIERAFRTFSHGLLETLPTFIGHNVAERTAIRARQSFSDRLFKKGEIVGLPMSSTQLQEFCDSWCASLYERTPHSGLGEKTPFAVFTESKDLVRTIQDERALDMLLAEAPKGSGRTVGKKGIPVEKAWFVHPDLAPLIGERVTVRLDPDELGHIYVYDGAGETFICIAECPERTGISRAEVAAASKARQAEASRIGRQTLLEAKRSMKGEDIHTVILEHREREAAKVHVLPRASEEYSTPQLEAASHAAQAMDAKDAEPLPMRVPVETRDARILELVTPAQRAKEERDDADRLVRERYAALLAQDPSTWTSAEAGWMAHMRTDPMIQSWLDMETLKGSSSETKK